MSHLLGLHDILFIGNGTGPTVKSGLRPIYLEWLYLFSKYQLIRKAPVYPQSKQYAQRKSHAQRQVFIRIVNSIRKALSLRKGCLHPNSEQYPQKLWVFAKAVFIRNANSIRKGLIIRQALFIRRARLGRFWEGLLPEELVCSPEEQLFFRNAVPHPQSSCSSAFFCFNQLVHPQRLIPLESFIKSSA